MAHLAKLAEALEGKAGEYRAIEYETAVARTAQQPLDEATAAALEEIAGRVHQIDWKNKDPERALAALKELAAELDRDAAQASSQQAELPSIASLLFNPSKLFEMLGNTGRITGLKQALEIIGRFIVDASDPL